MNITSKLFNESPYNFPDKKGLKDVSNNVPVQTPDPFNDSNQVFPSRYAIGEKVKFKIGPNAIVDATIYAARFEASTVWYDLIFDPYIGTDAEGGYTILTNVRSLMIHPQEFQERVQRITFQEAREIKMKVYNRFFQENHTSHGFEEYYTYDEVVSALKSSGVNPNSVLHNLTKGADISVQDLMSELTSTLPEIKVRKVLKAMNLNPDRYLERV